MKIRLSALVSACALACSVAPTVHAADAHLGHVVVPATRQPISADAALASVDVIERDEIAEAFRVARPARDGGFLAVDAALHVERPLLGILAAQERLIDVLPLPTDLGSPGAGF